MQIRLKIKLMLLFFAILPFMVYSQELVYKVVEKKGKVDLKTQAGQWQSVNEGDYLISGSEIFTGLHSHLSLEIFGQSYITIKQLTHLIIENSRLKKNEINSEFRLINGYCVVSSKKEQNLSSKILILFNQGNVLFNQSGGDVYLRDQSGVIIKSFKGKVQVRSRIKNLYFIRKGEMCAITHSGKLIESDYFLKKQLVIPPLEYQSESEIENYYDHILNFYSLDKNRNDYGDAFGKD